MNYLTLIKYFVRLAFLQVTITIIFIWYFDNFLILNEEQKFNLYLNLVEDRDRFLQFIPLKFITVDLILGIIVFIFLIVFIRYDICDGKTVAYVHSELSPSLAGPYPFSTRKVFICDKFFEFTPGGGKTLESAQAATLVHEYAHFDDLV